VIEETAAIEDDGLITPEIGSWGEEKYRHVALYASLFVKSMRNKWDCLVYIDLFSGAGRARIRSTARIVNSSPMAVLGLADKFDRYIFCEKDRRKSEALRKRIKKNFPELDTHVIDGDANKKVAEILEKMPSYRKDYRVLAFCFVDPYALNNLRFDTLRGLATRYMDFLVLIPSGMDAHRFESIYVKPDNLTIDEFLDNNEWRCVWTEFRKKGIPFERFIVQQFGKSMETLDYLSPGFEDTKLIRSYEKNLLLYRLVLYSRHAIGKEFWQQTKKYSQSQQEMF
jgi:three-Cys-motif partner protein